MKNKLRTSLLISLSIILITTIVQAVNIKITLPDDLKQTNIQNQGDICLYAINEAKDESVIVVGQQNELTKKVSNLKQLDEESFKTFLDKYNEAKLQEGQTVLKQEIYEKNNMVFVDTIFEYTNNDKKIQTEEYYTIVNESAITISASFLQKQVDSVKVREMIDSINILENTKPNLESLVIPIILIVLIIIYFIKEKRNKVQLDEAEKKKVLSKVIDYIGKIDYSKFRGILILFAVTIGVNIINLFFGIIEVVPKINWVEYSMMDKIYTISGILQNVIQLIAIIYITYCLTQKENETINRIKNTFIAMLIGVALLTILRVVIQIVFAGINENFVQYIISETQVFTRSAVYILIWYFYFKNSIRVSVYYKEKTIEQIVMEPKKGYQANEVNKRIMEFKIIEYFEEQKAYDYASGIYINKLPKEYANSLSLSDLNTKKIIKLKRAKYYLSKKDLENPKSQNRKTIRTVLSVIGIYLFVLLILYIL
ncbi:MAG: hypothetical protein J6A04_06495 [Clostridia bacterium]|nr:hypothetical protein [Clostridia bacterium]